MSDGEPLHKQAYEDYINNVSTKEIAQKYNVSESTVRSWKKRYWGNKAATKKKQRCNAKRKTLQAGAQNVAAEIIDKKLAEEVEKNEELTEKQKLFCLFYVKSFNAARSYQKAFDCSRNTADAHAWEMLRKVAIKEEIDRLKKMRNMALLATEDDLVEFHMKIAFSDITDFVEFGREEMPVMGAFGPITIKDEKGNKSPLIKTVNTVRFRESTDVDGRLINEVKQGKDGASVKLADRQKSLEFLERWFKVNPLDRHKIDYDNAKTEYNKRRLELEEKKVNESLNKNKEDTLTAIEQHNKKIETLSNLLNSPVENRKTEDFEEDDNG